MLECSLPIRPMSHLALVPKGASVRAGGPVWYMSYFLA